MNNRQELLEKVRAAKEAKGLSYQDIVDITEKNGEAVSIATVQRFFKKDSHPEEFRYSKTVQPIVHAVLGMYEELDPPQKSVSKEQAEEYVSTIEALKSLAELKHARVMELNHEVEYLKGIVSDYKSEIKWQRRLILAFGTIATIAIVAIIIDLAFGHVGWIRY